MTTGTVGKDVGSMLLNFQAAQGSKGAGDASGFQKVWNSQMNSSTAGDNAAGAAENQNRPEKRDAGKSVQSGQAQDVSPEDSLRADQIRKTQSLDKTVDEVEPEDLEQAMEVLGTAAVDLMRQIADVFGITMEQLQQTMDDLGMESLDVFDASALGELFLKLGGGENVYALITDEMLYGNYRMLMENMQNLLQANADELGLTPEELRQLVEQHVEKDVQPEELVPAAEEIVPKETYVAEEDKELRVEPSAGKEMPLAAQTADGMTEDAVQPGWGAQNENSGQTESDRRQEKSSDKGQQHDNVYVQNFRVEQFAQNTGQTESAHFSSAWDADTQDIMNQIMDHMKLQLNADTKSLEMQLHPESLGTLHVQIASKGGVVTANFITQNEAVKAALESQMIQLKESFEEQGVKIEAIEVTVQTHEFERNLEQGRGRQQQEPQKRNRARRINLNDPVTLEELDEEEELAAKMMAVSGSTVEYTA